MSDDVITGVRRVIQDLVSPDLKAIQVSQSAQAEALKALEASVNRQMELLSRQLDLQFKAFMSSLDSFRAEIRAHSELEVKKQVSPLAERVAALEAVVNRS